MPVNTGSFAHNSFQIDLFIGLETLLMSLSWNFHSRAGPSQSRAEPSQAELNQDKLKGFQVEPCWGILIFELKPSQQIFGLNQEPQLNFPLLGLQQL